MTGLDNVELHLVNDLDTADKLMAWLGERHDGEIAFDTETSGLSPETDVVRLAQIGDSRQGWAIPWERWGGVFEEVITRYDGPLYAHNAKYDYSMLKAAGCTIPQGRLHDTRLMAHVLHPTYSTALKKLAAKYVDPRAGMLQNDLGLSHTDGGTGNGNQGWTWATVPVDYGPYWQYGALDTVLTSQLAAVLEVKMDETGCRRAYDLELAASFVCERMERNGVPIDVPFARAKEAEFQRRAEAMIEQCLAEYGCKPSANAAVAQALIDAGVSLDRTTATGAIQMDKEVLGDVDHPLAHLVLEYRRLTKLSSTYLRHFNTERLHPRINSVGARTGRMSMDGGGGSGCNLQNLPRKADASPEAIEVRNCVAAPEGQTLISCDLSQIEVRVLAHVTNMLGYPELVNAFLSPEDFFVVIARDVFQEPDFQKSDQRRTTVKSFVYGSNYGAGTEKLAQTAKVSMDQAQVVADGLARSYPGIKALARHIEANAIKRAGTHGSPFVSSFLTGRRHPADDSGLYKLVNFLVQGTAAEIFKMQLIEMENIGLGEKMILPIHDEILLCCDDDDVEETTRAVLSVMNNDSLLAMPITASASSAKRWGEIDK